MEDGAPLTTHPVKQQPAILPLPVEVRPLADPCLAADLGHRRVLIALPPDERILQIWSDAVKACRVTACAVEAMETVVEAACRTRRASARAVGRLHRAGDHRQTAVVGLMATDFLAVEETYEAPGERRVDISLRPQVSWPPTRGWLCRRHSISHLPQCRP